MLVSYSDNSMEVAKMQHENANWIVYLPQPIVHVRRYWTLVTIIIIGLCFAKAFI